MVTAAEEKSVSPWRRRERVMPLVGKTGSGQGDYRPHIYGNDKVI